MAAFADVLLRGLTLSGQAIAIGGVAFALIVLASGWAPPDAALLLACALGLVVAGAWTSHAAARAGHRATLMALDALHQLAAAVWLGGLFHLLVAVFGSPERPWPPRLLQRFSAMALGAVGVLVAAGAGPPLGFVGGLHPPGRPPPRPKGLPEKGD